MRALLEARRDQAFHLHVLHLELQAHLAAEDDDLAHEVRARQVVARIRLGVTLGLGVLHDVGERRLAVVDVEQIGQRAGEDALDARDLVAGLAQVAQRRDHRQARAHGGFVEIGASRRPARFLQRFVVRQRAACSPSCSA